MSQQHVTLGILETRCWEFLEEKILFDVFKQLSPGSSLMKVLFYDKSNVFSRWMFKMQVG